MAETVQLNQNKRRPFDIEMYPSGLDLLAPPNPVNGTWFTIQNVSDSSLPWTLDPTPHNIQSPYVGNVEKTPLLMAGRNSAYQFAFDQTNGGVWRCVGSHLSTRYEEWFRWDTTNDWTVLAPDNPLLVTPTVAGLQAPNVSEDVSYRFHLTLTADVLLPSNNTDVSFKWDATATQGTIASATVWDWAASPRSNTAPKSMNMTTFWDVPAGSTNAIIDFDTTDLSGSGSTSRREIIAEVKIG